MKWTSTVAALMVLALSGPLHADQFDPYQQNAGPEDIGGPEITNPGTNESSAFDSGADAGAFESGTFDSGASQPGNQDAGTVNDYGPYYDSGTGAAGRFGPQQTGAQGAGSVLATPAANRQQAAVEQVSTPRRGAGYAYGAGGHGYEFYGKCCPNQASPYAEGLWSNYCNEKQSEKQGWFGGRMCGCGSGMFAPRAQCGCSMQQPTCGYAQPACGNCGGNPCKCHGMMPGMFSRKHCYGSAPCATYGNATWSDESTGTGTPEEVVEPVPPTPAPDAEILQSDAPQSEEVSDVLDSGAPASDVSPQPEAKSARKGLFQGGFRLFPGLLGR